MLNSSRYKNEGTHTAYGEERRRGLCDPGSEFLLGGSAVVLRGKYRNDETRKNGAGSLSLEDECNRQGDPTGAREMYIVDRKHSSTTNTTRERKVRRIRDISGVKATISS